MSESAGRRAKNGGRQRARGVRGGPAATCGVFRTAEVARILAVPPARVRALARAGLRPSPRRGRALEFSFQDLVLLRAAHGLVKADVPPRRVRRALAELWRQLPPDRPLSGVRIYADGRQVVVRTGRTAWRPDSGQVVFTFAVDDLARAAAEIRSVGRGRPAPTSAGQTAAPDASAWFERALELENAADREAAGDAYRRALAIDPGLTDAYINLGRLQHEAGDPAAAARLYHLALERAPRDPVAHYNLGVALEDQQRTAAAVSHYRRALALDPEFADAHFNLGRLLQRDGRQSEAMRHLLAYKKLTRDG